MGTRSLTIVKDEEGQALVTIYRQFDGYPTGLGKDLKAILAGHRLVNGLGGDRKAPVFNGAGCMAATVVAKLKEDAGNVYIYPAGSHDCGEEYVYTIKPGENGQIAIEVRDCYGEEGHALYDGPVDQFDPEKAEAAETV